MQTRKRKYVDGGIVVRRAASEVRASAKKGLNDPEKRTGRHPELDGVDDDDPDPDADILLDDELTAQPSHFEFDAVSPVPETGLSVDPEDLGRQALVEATQQDNFES